MSSYTYYQAIPKQSRLLERLRGDMRFCRLYTRLIPYGPGPFHLEALDADELDGILDEFASNAPFASRADVDACLEEITAEVDGVVRADAGLAGRAAYIEKEHREIEEPLARELARRGAEADATLMRTLLYGGERLASGFFAPHEPQLRLIPAQTVGAGAKLLTGVELSEEEHGVSDYACEQYQEWKRLILEAAARNEAILVFRTG